MVTASKTQTAQANGVPKKPATPRAPVRKPAASKAGGAAKSTYGKAAPVSKKAASVAGGENPTGGVTSAYAIMAGRIANRVAEMAESITFVER